MRFVIQRVKKAAVSFQAPQSEIAQVVTNSIEGGFLVLIGVSQEDVIEFFDNNNHETADKMIRKLTNMRIFEDENGKTNLSIDAVQGELLLISQFTLYADCKHGNRPSFVQAGEPGRAEELYNYIVDKCREYLDGEGASKSERESRIKTGEFGAHMEVSLINDGPFTIVLDSRDI